ncbi:hypothetical protein CHU00_13880 [Sphingobacterium cellulitidis]|uniref:RNA polymerase sigma factor n=1 Tax=Sphingobacterium cellulitidis TaxID=1768011 RepID=UPI000B93BC42|nr:sigma-70 family RNA polymerase sigma factor [Sphingobacterium cellulitidis]OYD45066.1 hypothetical protein CHU00_13880 [Sphingobacterium cellulitidis]
MNQYRDGINKNFDELSCIQAMSLGDVTAFNQLYQHYHRPVHANILKFVKNPDQSAEILQDVFIALWQNRYKINTEKSVGGWLFVVSYNKSMNILKQKLKQSITYLEELDKELIADNTASIEIEEQFEIQLEILEEAVNELPPRKKEVFKLHRYEGCSKEDVANRLGISLSSVNDYLKQSNQTIRKYIISHHPEHIGKALLLLLLLQG